MFSSNFRTLIFINAFLLVSAGGRNGRMMRMKQLRLNGDNKYGAIGTEADVVEVGVDSEKDTFGKTVQHQHDNNRRKGHHLR